MRAHWRRAQVADLPRLLPWVRDRFVYEERERALLLKLWQEILATSAGESATVEDLDRPPGERVVAVGISAFVSDEFVEAIRAGVRPYAARQLLHLWASGKSPIVSPNSLRRGQSLSGLNLFLMHHGWPDSLTPGEVNEVRHALAQANLTVHRGYPLRLVFIEVFGAADAELLRPLGLRQWSGGERLFQGQPPPPPERFPYLLGVTREEALQAPGSFVFHLFSSPEPCCHFTSAEQAVLRFALEACTDEAIAARLGVALITVKKHWESIYRKVQRCGLPVFADSGTNLRLASQRGREKRRLVLEFVRDHPEELRWFSIGAPRRGLRKRTLPARQKPQAS